MSEPNAEPPPVVVTVRPIATPLSLGFLALAVASFLVSGLQLAWVSPVSQGHTIALLVLVVVVPLQAAGSIFGFLARDPAAAAGFGVLSGTWAGFCAATLSTPAGMTNRGLGLLLCASAGTLLVPIAASAWGKPLAAAVLLFAAGRFAVSGAYQLTQSDAARHAAGWLGIAVVATAVYAALAFELEGAAGRAVLPVGRIGRGRLAMRGDFTDEMRHVTHEPGVRRPL